MAVEPQLSRSVTWSERLQDVVGRPTRTALLVVGGLVVLSLGLRFWLAREIVTPWIMIDELRDAELAKSFATTGHFLIRDAPGGVVNVGYPALIAPAWWLHPMSMTYAAAKLINVILATSTAIPVFLWARRLVSPFHAVVAVVLTLAMPALIYTGTLMTENAFLPAFVLAAWVLALALERPTLQRQVLAFCVILLASLMRVQGLVLVAVVPTAILLKVLFEVRVERRERPLRFAALELRRYWVTAALLLGGGILYVLWELARGRTLSSGLGSYQDVAHGDYSLGDIRHWVWLHLAELPLALGVLPASAFLLLLVLALRRNGTRSPAERALLAVTAAAIPWVVAEVAVFASRFSFRIEERYMFFLAPLVFLTFVVWLDRGLPRPRILTLAVAAVPPLLFLALPLGSLLNVSIYSDTFEFIPLLRLSQLVNGISWTERLLVAGAVAAGLVFILWPRSWSPSIVLPGAVVVFFALSSYSVTGAIRDFAKGQRDLAGTSGSPSWIDHHLRGSQNASFLLGTTTDAWSEMQALWQQEFWNWSLGPVFNLSTPEPAGGPETPVKVTPQSGLIVSTVTGHPVRAPFVVTSSSYAVDGSLIATRPPFALYRTSGPLRVAEARSGIYGDSWMGADAAYTRYAPKPRGRLTVLLTRSAWRGPDVPGHARIQLIPLRGPRAGQAIATRTWTLHSGRGHLFTLPTPRTPFTVTVHIDPTFSPSQFGEADTRQLGAQVSFGHGTSTR